jgi:hypothetical protein
MHIFSTCTIYDIYFILFRIFAILYPLRVHTPMSTEPVGGRQAVQVYLTWFSVLDAQYNIEDITLQLSL